MSDRLGCSSICFRSLSFNQALEVLVDLGFTEIDLGAIPGFCEHYVAGVGKGVREGLVREIEQTGIRVRTVNADPGCFHLGGADRNGIRAAFLEYLTLAGELGAAGVCVGSGAAVSPGVAESAVAATAAGLRELAEISSDVGLPLLVEAPHSRQLVTTVAGALELVDRIDSDNVRLVLDTSHVYVSGVSPAVAARAFGARVAHVHLRDAAGSDIYLAIGEGEIDFSAFFEALEAIGYEGHCALELETPITPGPAKRQEVATSRDLVNNLWLRAQRA